MLEVIRDDLLRVKAATGCMGTTVYAEGKVWRAARLVIMPVDLGSPSYR